LGWIAIDGRRYDGDGGTGGSITPRNAHVLSRCRAVHTPLSEAELGSEKERPEVVIIAAGHKGMLT
jgi:hypothetical protein